MAVCMATTAPWIGGSSPSSRVPSSDTRTTAEAGWPCSDGPAVKYISCAPGTRTLTLPCPLAEMAPLATTRWAISATCSARSLSMTHHPSRGDGNALPCGSAIPSRDGPDAGRVPPGQLTVELGVGLHPLPGARAELTDDARGDPGGEQAVTDDHPRRDRGPGRDHGAAAHDRAVEHGGAVADQRFGADDRAVHDAQVTDGRPLPHLGHRVGPAVQDRPVLDIGAAADQDRPEVGPQHGPVPDRRLGLHVHVPDQGGGGRDPRAGADVRLAAFEGEQWHLPMMHAGTLRRPFGSDSDRGYAAPYVRASGGHRRSAWSGERRRAADPGRRPG